MELKKNPQKTVVLCGAKKIIVTIYINTTSSSITISRVVSISSLNDTLKVVVFGTYLLSIIVVLKGQCFCLLPFYS